MARDTERLIWANFLKAEFTGNFQTEYTVPHIHALIDSQYTVDAVEVVRCKDCAHFVFWHTRCMCDLAVQNGENPEFYCANAVLSDSGRRKREWDEYNKTYAAIADRRNEPCLTQA